MSRVSNDPCCSSVEGFQETVVVSRVSRVMRLQNNIDRIDLVLDGLEVGVYS